MTAGSAWLGWTTSQRTCCTTPSRHGPGEGPGGCSPDHPTVLLAHQPLAAKRALQARPDINPDPFWAHACWADLPLERSLSPELPCWSLPGGRDYICICEPRHGLLWDTHASGQQGRNYPAHPAAGPRPHPACPPGSCLLAPCPLSPSLCRVGLSIYPLQPPPANPHLSQDWLAPGDLCWGCLASPGRLTLQMTTCFFICMRPLK